MLKRVLAGFGTLLVLFFAACGGPNGDGTSDDQADDSILDGISKSDMAQAVDGSPEVCGVLKLVNEATTEKLQGDVALDQRSSTNIASFRLGADGQANTADDRRINSLAQLDQIKYVGRATYSKLVAYVKAQDLACKDLAIQIDAFSDWHGQLDPVSVTNVGSVGGASALSSYFAKDRAKNPNTLLLAAGDVMGASPPLAGNFEEQPVVEALNLMRLDAVAIGNHEFDRGLEHIERMISISNYPYVSANLDKLDENLSCPKQPDRSCIKPYVILPVLGVQVAVIGITTPEMVSKSKPENIGTLAIAEPIEAANQAREDARKKGAQVFIAIAHLGATSQPQESDPLIAFVNGLQGFDLVVGGHEHNEVSTVIDGMPVVETKSQGVEYFRVQLSYSFVKRAVDSHQVELVTPINDQNTVDQRVVDLLDPYRKRLSQEFDAVIGKAEGLFERGNNIERMQEVPIGNLVTDALRWRYNVDFAFTNSGGIRASIPSSYSPLDRNLSRPDPAYRQGLPYDLVVGDVYTVLPYGNLTVTRTITGAQIWTLLEHSVEYLPAPKGSFGQLSGVRFTFDSSKPAGSRVVSVNKIDGPPIAADETSYTMATSDFVDLGGDGYAMLKGGDGVLAEKMADVLLAYIQDLGTITPSTDERMMDLAGQ